MKRTLNIIFAAVAALVLCLSCVKEDRQKCPASLVVDAGSMIIPEGFESGVIDVYVLDANGRIVFSDMRRWRDTLVIEVSLERKPYRLVTFLSADSVYGYQDGTDLVFPQFSQGVRFWAESRDVVMDGDVLSVIPQVHKQYSKVTVSCRTSGGGAAFPSDCDIEVGGGYAGCRMSDLSAIARPFRYVVREDDVDGPSGAFSFIMPRQGGRSIALSFYSREQGRPCIASFELWRFLERAGYDFGAEDLLDVSVEIDLLRGVVAINIAGYNQYTIDSIY